MGYLNTKVVYMCHEGCKNRGFMERPSLKMMVGAFRIGPHVIKGVLELKNKESYFFEKEDLFEMHRSKTWSL